jgi:ubiquinone/menaquinone biosynthesis C-methylase UbiE
VSVPPLAQVFDEVAGMYEDSRPSYPQAALDLLNVGPGRRVLDLGAGTGKLTRLLAGTGAEVTAVEPLDAMRAKLEEAVPSAEAHAGTAERIPLADATFDVVTVAQAFHWFDPDRALPEIARVLVDGGGLAVMWNAWDPTDPIGAQILQVLAPHDPPDLRRRHETALAVLSRSELFRGATQRTHHYTETFDVERLVGRVASISFIASAAEEVRDKVEAAVRGVAPGAGQFAVEMRTNLCMCQRRARAA